MELHIPNTMGEPPQMQAPETPQAETQEAPDTFLTEAATVFGQEFKSRDEVKNHWSELNSYKTKYEENSQRFGEYEKKAKEADEYESLPLVKQFKEFVKTLDPTDPAKAMSQVGQFTKIHATDWSALAEKDPVAVIVEREYAESDGDMTRDEIDRMVRKKLKVDESYYDMEDDDSRLEMKAALSDARKKAREAAEFFNGKKADFSKHPALASREQQEAAAQAFAQQYKAAIQEAAGSLKQLEFGDFKYEPKSEQGLFTKALFESPDSFAKALMLDETGKNYDPMKMVRYAIMMDNINEMIKASAGTAKSEGIKEVLTDASRTSAPGTQVHNNGGKSALPRTPSGFFG